MLPSSAPPRLHFAEEPGRLKITIERRRGLGPLLFLGVWLVGFSLAASSTAGNLTREPWSTGSIFLALWLVGWALGGPTVAALVLFIGQETVAVANGALRLGVRIGPFRRDRAFALAGVENLRADGPMSPPARSPGKGRRTWGGIAFEHTGRTIRFGIGLENPEAHRVLAAIRGKLSSG
jgi:hypothetical protein